MRICSINAAGAAHLGLVTARGVVDATAAGYPQGIDAVIAGADTAPLRALAEDESLPVIEARNTSTSWSTRGSFSAWG